MTTGQPLSTLEHLAEMDRLLRDIQAELAPEREPAPALEVDPTPAPPATPGPQTAAAATPGPPTTAVTPDPPAAAACPHPPPPPARDPSPPPPDALLQGLTELVTALVSATRELTTAYDRALAQAHPSPPPTPLRRRDDPEVTLSAGPFASTARLRAFEAAVSDLPGVREVTVRGYPGADRALLEVRLDPETT